MEGLEERKDYDQMIKIFANLKIVLNKKNIIKINFGIKYNFTISTFSVTLYVIHICF
jgi:hypothetical protein